MVHLNIIFPKMNETWGHISYGVTTHVYRRETYYSVENYTKSYLMGKREKKIQIYNINSRSGKKGSLVYKNKFVSSIGAWT